MKDVVISMESIQGYDLEQSDTVCFTTDGHYFQDGDSSCFTYWEKGAIEKCPIVWIEKGIKAGNLILRDISRHETTPTRAPLVQIDRTAEIRRLVAENISQTTAPGVTAPAWVNEATIEQCIERNIDK